ncbi:MAG: PKD domain-containing protein [Gemmatimonadaceae bacterium]
MSRTPRKRYVMSALTLFTLVGVAAVAACRDERVTAPPTAPAEAPAPAAVPAEVTAASLTTLAEPVVLVGAGDVASCSKTTDEATAVLLDGIAGTVFVAGDGAYADGTAAEYANCYQPTWGRHKARTIPAAGERDYNTTNAAGYYGYFGAAAGDPAKGYYSLDLGAWHVVVLNSKLSTSATSAQVKWLKADLSASTKSCTVAIWHRPMFYSSGSGGLRASLKPAWDALMGHGAELIINADQRYYERYAPQTPDGVADPALGIREFIVGTGGANTTAIGTVMPNSEVRNSGTSGVLKLTLSDGSYAWEFVPVAGKTFTDAGTGNCHAGPPPVAVPGGPYGAEGTVTLDGSASYDPEGDIPLTYDWDFGDGSAHGTVAQPTHTYAATGTYTATLVVTNTKGEVSAPATTIVSIENQPPVVDAGVDRWHYAGLPVAITFGASDPGGVGDGPWTYRVTWGDGAESTGSATSLASFLTASHPYAAVGDFVATVAVTDKDGGTGYDAIAVHVKTPGSPITLLAAGDMGDCSTTRDEQTSDLMIAIPDAPVATLGDNAYPSGTAEDYANCYGSGWGRLRQRTYPALGNHEYDQGNAEPSFDYFGVAAGPRGKGYYSFDVGDWHIIVLNDNTAYTPVAKLSEQDLWLQADLAASSKRCTLAIFHQPMVMSSNTVGYIYRSSRKPIWDRLYAAHAELVLNGHQHHYERFSPMRPDRTRDDVNGIREFIVGTGGESASLPTADIAALSEVRSDAFGVMKITLRPDGYDWQFLPIAGYTFADSGSGTCH